MLSITLAEKKFQGSSDAELYGDFIQELDWMVGEVTQALEKHGLDDNTLVIFTSDNGGMFNGTGQKGWSAGHRMNGDLLGVKFGAWEGGHRVPFIAHWPGKIKAGSISNDIMSHLDWVPTLMAAAGDADVKQKLLKGMKVRNRDLLHAAMLASDNRAIPAVVFTDPEIAWAGITQDEAKQAGRDVTVATYPWAASGRSLVRSTWGSISRSA